MEKKKQLNQFKKCNAENPLYDKPWPPKTNTSSSSFFFPLSDGGGRQVRPLTSTTCASTQGPTRTRFFRAQKKASVHPHFSLSPCSLILSPIVRLLCSFKLCCPRALKLSSSVPTPLLVALRLEIIFHSKS